MAKYKYKNSVVKDEWPKLTLMQLAEGQNKINGSTLATTHLLNEALKGVIKRLEALERAMPKGQASQKQRTAVATLHQTMGDVEKFIMGIGGEQPPGCTLPKGF